MSHQKPAYGETPGMTGPGVVIDGRLGISREEMESKADLWGLELKPGEVVRPVERTMIPEPARTGGITGPVKGTNGPARR